MKIILEPTEEMFDAPVNGVKVPTRVWVGRIEGDIEIEAYILSVVPKNDGDTLEGKMPSFMRRSREAYSIAVEEKQKAEMEEWAKSIHETGGPPK